MTCRSQTTFTSVALSDCFKGFYMAGTVQNDRVQTFVQAQVHDGPGLTRSLIHSRCLQEIVNYIQTKYTTMTTWQLIEDSPSTLICGKLLRQMSFWLSIIGLSRGLLVRDWIDNN